MKRLLLSLISMLAIGLAWADSVTVPNVEIMQGQTGYLEFYVTIDGGKFYKGFQFDVALPEKVTCERVTYTDIEKGEDGNPIVVEKEGPAGDLADAVSSFVLSRNFVSSTEPQLLRYVCYSAQGSTMNTANVANMLLLRIPVTVNEELAVGTTVEVTLSDISFSDYSNVNYKFDNITAEITIIENRITLDETVGVTLATPTGEQNVLVKRTIKADEWSTICLPFDMSADQIARAFDGTTVELADFDGCEATYDESRDNCLAIKVNFTTANTITANKPCLIKVSEGITEFNVDGVIINPDEVNARVDKDETKVKVGNKTYLYYNSIIGTYTPETVIGSSEEDGSYQLFISDGKFYYSKGTAKSKAFRAYFDFYDELTDKTVGASAKMSFSIDGVVTGIEDLRSNVPVEGIYDLSGRKIKLDGDDLSRLPKGVYIMDGKKVTVK